MRSTRSRRWGRSSLVVSVVMVAALLIPFAGSASATHGTRVLDVVPDVADLGIGSAHTLTAKLCEVGATPGSAPANPDSTNCTPAPATFDSGPINIDFEFENHPLGGGSANDPDNGSTRGTPDDTCSIAAGLSTCQIQYTGNVSGDDQIRAWIDHDGDNDTVEADTTEQQDERAVPGNQPAGDPFDPDCIAVAGAEEDCTDVVTASFAAGTAVVLDCDDETGPNREQETNPAGGPQGNETYTCRTFDAEGNATADADGGTSGNQTVRVHAEVECDPRTPVDSPCPPTRNGVNDPDDPDSTSYGSEDYGCNIAASGGNFGRCTITVTQGELETGTADICFFLGDATTGNTLCGNEPVMEETEGDGSDEWEDPDTGGDAADRVEKTWQARTSAGGGVDAEPEEATNDTGAEHAITATVYDQFGDAFSGASTTVNFEFFAGSPSDTDGNTPASPDETCSTNNSSSCSHTYTSNTTGRDLVCVWTNSAPTMTGTNQNGTCAGEGRNDADDTAGSADAPNPKDDDVDVVSKTWVNAEPATEVNCIPETEETRRTDDHVINCTASNENGTVPGTEIDVEASGANDPDGSNSPGTPDFTCMTNSSGSCQVTHDGSSSNTLGDTTYRAWNDEDYFHGSGSNEADQDEDLGDNDEDNTDVVRNTWIAAPERTITLDTNGRARRRGRAMRFFGLINGDPNCEDAETVRLRRRNKGARRFKTIATTASDDNGGYGFRITIRRTADYKTVTPRTTTPDNCDKAVSNVKRVRAKKRNR